LDAERCLWITAPQGLTRDDPETWFGGRLITMVGIDAR